MTTSSKASFKRSDKETPIILSPKEAIDVILEDKDHYPTSLNYAINYCKASIDMREGSEEFKVQCLYILGNLTSWRHPLAREVRNSLRKAGKR